MEMMKTTVRNNENNENNEIITRDGGGLMHPCRAAPCWAKQWNHHFRQNHNRFHGF